jgi:spore coat protein U-like protein
MRSYLLANAVVASLLLGSVSLASAATATANLNVTAQVNANCSIATTAVAFGVYDPITAHASADLDATGGVTIACTKGTATINVGLGLGNNASGAVRRMSDGGTERLTYELFHPASNAVGAACAYTTVWGTTGANLLSLTAAPSKAGRLYSVCGRVASGQDPAAGSYTDTVVATVTF